MTPGEFYRILFLRTLGNFLVLFSIYIIVWIFYKPALEEVKFAINQLTNKQYILPDDVLAHGDGNSGSLDEYEDDSFKKPENDGPKGLLGKVLQVNQVEVLVPKDPNFSLIVPKLGANANIIPNVDSANVDEYLPVLKAGIAHAAGTKFPGENGHIYLFAHSTNTFANVSRYNAIFYLLYKLEQGDEVNLYYQGIRHKYNVTGSVVVDPSEVGYITRQTDTEFLTMQTCWPPGTTLQRLLIFAEPAL